MIRTKRAYEPPEPSDGKRVLVDRLWPRGRSRAALDLAEWDKDVAPSDALRQWFGHDPNKWDEFRKRYDAELDQHPGTWEPLLKAARRGRVTLVYGAKDEEHNQAVALKEYLERKSGRKSGR